MSYSKFTVKNFRCFGEEQVLEFAIPNIEKIGSGLTYIVGANNSGKTTLIESMWIKKGHYLNDSEKKGSATPIFKLYNGETLLKTVELIRDDAYEFKEDPERQNNEDLFEIVSSRRHWDSIANNDSKSIDIIVNSSVADNPRKPQNIQTASLLRDIDHDTERHNQFTQLVQKVIPEFTGWAVGFENQPYIKYVSGGFAHKTDFLGDGLISVIRILAHLFEQRNSGLIIDEPELSLHPQAQKRLAKLIAEYSKKRQIILSTHSPYFISWDYLKNGAKLNRVIKMKDQDSVILQLKWPSNYESLIDGANWQQPFLFDEVAKEIFFADDNIVFLEGQEDVGLLRNEFSGSDINVFGYGIRGCNNFKFALTLATDLGFKKAGVILDKGTNEDAVFSDLTLAFPSYKIAQWNKNDIRDKLAVTTTVKEGYFTEDGKKKDESQLDDFNLKIDDVKTYFLTNS